MSKILRSDQQYFHRQLDNYLYLAELYKDLLEEKPDIRRELTSCVDSTTLCITELGNFKAYKNTAEYDAEITKVQVHLARVGDLINQLLD